MPLDSRKKSRQNKMVCSKSFEMKELREIGQKKADQLRNFLMLWIGIIDEGFQMEGKECKAQERLMILRKRFLPVRKRCFCMG